ncbi:MAG: DUF1328 domain-containing protein [Pseudomonas sp.]
MLGWAITFLLVAIGAAVMGFGGVVSGIVAALGKFCFLLFMLLFITSFIVGMGRRLWRLSHHSAR